MDSNQLSLAYEARAYTALALRLNWSTGMVSRHRLVLFRHTLICLSYQWIKWWILWGSNPVVCRIKSPVACRFALESMIGQGGGIRTPGVNVTPRPKRGPLPDYGLHPDYLAPPEGFEPSPTILETVVLPVTLRRYEIVRFWFTRPHGFLGVC